MNALMDIQIDGVSFDGFEQGFADRAGAALQAALMQGLNVLEIEGVREIAALDLEGLDFSDPERLGQSLAQAILIELAK